MGLIKEFKEFVMRGNVIDLAVGVVTGTAFSKIVSSLVENIITPPLGYLINGVDFKQLSVKFQPLAIPGFKPPAPVEMKYGLFLQALFDFIIVAFVLFMVLRTINRIKRLAEITPPPKPDVPPEPTKEEKLLTEIRDLMKEQLAKS